MRTADWIVLIVTLSSIILYGVYKSRSSRNMEGYFLSNRNMPWWLVLLSIMGTQASAITFLSAPGLAYTDGMRFLQNYFGLPLAMIVLCISFVPLFNKLKLFTAYEFLEQRFDTKTRTFTAALFLLSRGLSTGVSIYAPSIILSSLLGWDIYWTNIVMGGLLIIYTVTGGAKAVAYTQQLQFMIIVLGMTLAGYYMIHLLPENMGFTDALYISGASEKLNVITTGFKNGHFDWSDRYNIYSGLIGGFFLSLSYFGTDQSQVGRYLTAKNTTESKLSLLMNGLVKIPMQFGILLLGALLFCFYQFNEQPIFFNATQQSILKASPQKENALRIEQSFAAVNLQKQTLLKDFHPKDLGQKKILQDLNKQSNLLKEEYKVLLKKVNADTNDTNYIFLRYVIDHLPTGIVGLMIAIIFLAAWGSIAAALNSLASCTMVDFHLRFKKQKDFTQEGKTADEHNYQLSKWYTLAWGVFCIFVAQYANKMGSLIEAVNILGSLFYGVILGIFLVAFYRKKIQGNAVFLSALLTQILIIVLFTLNELNYIELSFLWLNAVGAIILICLAEILQRTLLYPNKQLRPRH
jgi:solute:Na+ symporter, SSS family